ncbi:MAG: hypothetical protein IPO37_13180 [Saprospiraceae bacterium]|jgi:hypothetical protein|nr:hypothetical protein [Saprospiraceae bacterium]
MRHNVLALGEGGDFQHKTSYEAPNCKFSQNWHTKHLTATFAKRLLGAGVLIIRLLVKALYNVWVMKIWRSTLLSACAVGYFLFQKGRDFF